MWSPIIEFHKTSYCTLGLRPYQELGFPDVVSKNRIVTKHHAAILELLPWITPIPGARFLGCDLQL
jgi:hypothetical protein